MTDHTETLQAVWVLHFPHRRWRTDHEMDEHQDRCDECNQLWPCRTARVLRSSVTLADARKAG